MRELLPGSDGSRLQLSEPFFNIALQRLGKIPHTNIIMLYFKKVKEMLKFLKMLLSRVIFSGEILPIGYFWGFFQKINSLCGHF